MSTVAELKRIFNEYARVETVSGNHLRILEASAANDKRNACLRRVVELETQLFAAIVYLPDDPCITSDALKEAGIQLPVRFDVGGVFDSTHSRICTVANPNIAATDGHLRKGMFETRGALIASLLNSVKP